MKRNVLPPPSTKEQAVLAPRNLPYQMFLLVQQMSKRFQQVLNPYGITPLHWGILSCLWEDDGLRTTEIATRLEQLGGTVTVGLDVMEREGFIRRKKDKSDRRISRIFLTPRGKVLENPVKAGAGALIDDMFVSFSAAEYRTLVDQVARLRKAVAASQPS